MKKTIVTFFAGILFLMVFISIGLSVVLFYRPFYYMEINRLNIEKTSGYSKDEIKENYNTLIDYCSPFSDKTLTFPTFSSSKEGLIHFEEVKQIINLILLSGFISFLLLIIIILQKKKAEDFHYLRSSALITIILPLFVLLVSSINFDKTFIIFHKIAFRNDYWVFSPETDPIIKILPQAFFLDAALLIAVFIILGSICLEISYRILKKSNRGGLSQM